ncbi:MAG: hypothetical protein H7281_16480 [Bacteriovorax sp.]|nr:hypothetical protein [Bacteriovorax sp.]
MNIKKITPQEMINFSREKIIDLVSIGQLAKKWHDSIFVKIEPSVYKNKESWKIIFQINSEREIRELLMYISTKGDFVAANFND